MYSTTGGAASERTRLGAERILPPLPPGEGWGEGTLGDSVRRCATLILESPHPCPLPEGEGDTLVLPRRLATNPLRAAGAARRWRRAPLLLLLLALLAPPCPLLVFLALLFLPLL